MKFNSVLSLVRFTLFLPLGLRCVHLYRAPPWLTYKYVGF